MSDVDLKKMFPHRFQSPKLAPSAFVAPGAHVYGDVEIGEQSSIWFNTVLRGDVNYIRVGARTNIQDCSLVHVAYKAYPCLIGSDVTIGHSATIHACSIGNFTLIGMGSQVLDGAEIGDFVLLGAGSLVTPKMKIPSGSKAFGRPAKVVAELTEEERESLRFSALHYVNLAKTYK
jgi:carbonic anhydrase/acetyltransferase-like protein (isoleucine patch superfamily)